MAMAAGSTFNYFWQRRNPGGFDMYMFAVAVSSSFFITFFRGVTNMDDGDGGDRLACWLEKVLGGSSRLCWLLLE
jgi:hypothetical protein